MSRLRVLWPIFPVVLSLPPPCSATRLCDTQPMQILLKALVVRF